MYLQDIKVQFNVFTGQNVTSEGVMGHINKKT